MFISTRSRPCALSLVVLLSASLIAACGGGGPANAGGGGSGAKGFVARAYRFAACMRAHGLPDFPDPRVVDHNGGQSVAIQAVGGTPQFRRASRACRGILPTPADVAAQNAADARRHRRALLAFATCLRAHGFPSFPDPTVGGELSPAMLAEAGIDLHQPALLQAGDACVGVTHGAITKADVARAVNGPDASGSGGSSAGASSSGG